MSRKARIVVLLALAVFLSLQGRRMFGPWINEFDGAFQEMIAMHHLQSGFRANHFLPVIAEINGEKFYHTAHPPLLHIIYALLYRIFGVHEWVTRACSLFLLLASILLLSKLVDKKVRPFLWLSALFLPIVFRLGMTTNYELLTIFCVSLLLFSFNSWRAGRKGSVPFLCFALMLALLSDWPAYLAVPALFIEHIWGREERKMLVKLFALEVIFFAALIYLENSAAGEVALFAHGQTRSNPAYLLQATAYRELAQHLSWILSKPALILSVAALAGLLVAGRKLRAASVYGIWAWFVVLLWLSAANLTSRHYVYLLYLFPLIALALAFAASRLKHRNIAIIIILLSFITPDYVGYKTKDARAYYLAQKIATAPGVRSIFSSAALGTMFFYDKIETVVPVSEKTSQALDKLDFDALIIDRESAEVKGLEGMANRPDYRLAYAFPDLLVYLKQNETTNGQYLGSQLPEQTGAGWWKPSTQVVWFHNRAWYGLKQPPGPKGASRLELEAAQGCLLFKPALVHPPRSGKSDGAQFTVVGVGAGNKSLLYAKFLRAGDAPETEIPVRGLKNIELLTDAGPRGDYRFDDAYWLEAKSGAVCGARESE